MRSLLSDLLRPLAACIPQALSQSVWDDAAPHSITEITYRLVRLMAIHVGVPTVGESHRVLGFPEELPSRFLLSPGLRIMASANIATDSFGLFKRKAAFAAMVVSSAVVSKLSLGKVSACLESP